MTGWRKWRSGPRPKFETIIQKRWSNVHKRFHDINSHFNSIFYQFYPNFPSLILFDHLDFIDQMWTKMWPKLSDFDSQIVISPSCALELTKHRNFWEIVLRRTHEKSAELLNLRKSSWFRLNSKAHILIIFVIYWHNRSIILYDFLFTITK